MYAIPGFADKVMAEYPAAAYGSPAEAYAQVITDSWFAAPIYRIADSLDSKLKVYYYEFSDPKCPKYVATGFEQGTAHTYELPYLFPGFHGSSDIGTKLTPRQQKVARQMAKIWTGMSKVDEQGIWKRFDGGHARYLKLGQGKPQMADMKEYKKRHHFGFWKNIYMY